MSVPEVADVDAIRGDLTALARGGGLALAGAAMSGAFGFVLIVLVTRDLGAARAGLLIEAIALFTVLSNALELGADTGLVRVIARDRASGRVADLPGTVRVALWPVIVVSSAAAAVLFAAAGPIADLIVHGATGSEAAAYLRWMAPFLPFASVTTVALSGTRGFGSMAPYVVVSNVILPALRPALMAIVLAAGLGAAWIALAWAAPFAAGIVVSLLLLTAFVRRARAGVEDRIRATPTRALAASFWRFTAPRGLAALFSVLVIWADILLVGALRSAREAAIYAAASRYLIIGTFAIQAVALAIAPLVSGALAVGRRDRAEALYRASASWLVGLSWPFYLSIAVYAPLVMRLFGSGFERGSRALVILSVAVLVQVATGSNKIVLLMGGRSGWGLLSTAASLVANIGLNLVLIPRFGMVGAAVAWAITFALDNLITTIAVYRLLGMQPFGRGFIPVLVGSLAWYGGLGLLLRLAFGATVASFALFLVLATGGYALVLWRSKEALHIPLLLDAVRRQPAPTDPVPPVLER